jgi:hypothetical protein
MSCGAAGQSRVQAAHRALLHLTARELAVLVDIAQRRAALLASGRGGRP